MSNATAMILPHSTSERRASGPTDPGASAAVLTRRSLGDAHEQLMEARLALIAARRRVVQSEEAVAGWEHFVEELSRVSGRTPV